jgi:hypothetical protein
VPKPFQAGAIFEVMGRLLDVVYTYDDAEPGEPAAAGGPLAPERFSVLPAAVVEELATWLVRGDVGESLDMADRLALYDPALAADVKVAVQAYRFDDILDALERGSGADGR